MRAIGHKGKGVCKWTSASTSMSKLESEGERKKSEGKRIMACVRVRVL